MPSTPLSERGLISLMADELIQRKANISKHLQTDGSTMTIGKGEMVPEQSWNGKQVPEAWECH